LPGLLEREFTIADACAQSIGEGCGGFFAIGGHELSERGEQARLRKAVAVNAIVARFRPGFVQVAQCHHFLFAIGNRLARVNRILGNRHSKSPGVQADAQYVQKDVSTGIRRQ